MSDRISRKRLGAGKVAVLGSVVALGALAFGAYKLFFQRPGEAAIQLIPADAQFVVTLDTNPSEMQVATFDRIYAALKREGIAEKVDEGLTDLFSKSPVGKEIRPLVATSFAMAQFKADGQQGFAMLTALKDSGKVADILAKNGSKVGDRPPMYKVEEGNAYCSVIGDYLAVSDHQELITRVASLQDRTGSVADLPEYQTARAALPRDANLMVFISPQGLAEMQKSVANKSFSGASWFALGATVRDDGILFDYRSPLDSKATAALKAMAQTAALDPKLLSRYPAGAYGLLAYSQPARAWAALTGEARQNKDASKELDKGVSEFEKETGLSVQDDIVPAFNGDVSGAVYPGPSGKAEDLDFVVMVSDANGATPARLAAKVRALVEKKAAESKETFKFVETKIGEATLWEIDEATRARLFDSASKGQSSGPVLKGKTLIMAQVGGNIFVTSSRALVNQSLELARGGGQSLASDPAFAGMTTRVVEGSQANLMISLRRILDVMRPQIEESMKGGPVNADDVVSLFGDLGTGLVGSAKFDGDVMVGSLFLPLDYDRAITLIGKSMRNESKSPSGGTPVEAPPITK